MKLPYPRSRRFSLLEVADFLEVPKDLPRHERRRRARRWIRRLERRDGRRYLYREGKGRTSPLYATVAALEQLAPWDPGTLTAIRADVDAHGTHLKRLDRRVTGHDRLLSRYAQAIVKNAESTLMHARALAKLGQI